MLEHKLAPWLMKEQEYYKPILFHSINVARVAEAMTTGWDIETRELVIWGAILHDIGKLKVPLEILDKPARLTDEEMSVVMKHPLDGYKMLPKETPEVVRDIVLHHHEKADGSGYPDGLTSVPMTTAVIAAADIFDALCQNRAYHLPLSEDESYQEVKKLADDGKIQIGPAELLYNAYEATSSNGGLLRDGDIYEYLNNQSAWSRDKKKEDLRA